MRGVGVALLARLVGCDFFHTALGDRELPSGNGTGNVGRWLAHRAYNGIKNHPLHPVQGFCAEAGGAITLFLATYFGIPVSTTHTITGAIIGVGAARKIAAVRWNVASNVVFAWIVTLPATALFGSVFYELRSQLFL